jgi:2-methylaconitate cis-trans-isomerase PrpF
MTPNALEARAKREEDTYGQKELPAQLRAGAAAMRECERLIADIATYQGIVQDMTAEAEAAKNALLAEARDWLQKAGMA